jgi:hypothetical protein
VDEVEDGVEGVLEGEVKAAVEGDADEQVLLSTLFLLYQCMGMSSVVALYNVHPCAAYAPIRVQ